MLPDIHIELLSLVAPKSANLTFCTWNDTSVAFCLCTVVDGLVQVTNALGILGRHSTWKMRKFSLKKTWNLSITKLPLPLRMCLWHPPPTHQLSIWGSTAFKDHCTFAFPPPFHAHFLQFIFSLCLTGFKRLCNSTYNKYMPPALCQQKLLHMDIFLTNVRRFGRFHVHFSLFLAHHILQHFSPKTLLHWQCHTF